MVVYNVRPASKQTQFSRWRWIIFASLFVGWSFYYFSRKALPSSMPALIKHGGFSKDDIGMIASSFAASYGFSKFFGTFILDYIGARVMFSIGLGLSGICCVLFPLTNNVFICSTIWLIFGIAQGFGWNPCAKLLKEWYTPSQMGTWWSILSSAANVAGAISPVLFTYMLSKTSWQSMYFLTGVITSSLGIVVLLTIKNSPSDVGIHTSFGSSKKEADIPKREGDDKAHNWHYVFFEKDLWIAGTIYAILYLLKASLVDWSQLYFIQVAKRPETAAAACVSMMQFGGMLGNLVMGYISDFFLTPVSVKTLEMKNGRPLGVKPMVRGR